jgi:hypothetical protein
LGTPKFLTKLDAVSLLQAFCHFEWNENATNTCYTTSLSGSDRRIQRCCEAAKNHACAWKSLLPLRSVSSPFRHYLLWGKNIVGYFLDRFRVCFCGQTAVSICHVCIHAWWHTVLNDLFLLGITKEGKKSYHQ